MAASTSTPITQREIWSGERLALVLGYFHQGAGRAVAHVDANAVARSMGVSAGTVRRWVREQFPARRMRELEEKVLPAPAELEQERRELAYARAAVDEINEPGRRVNPAWAEQRWTEPHLLGLVKFEHLRVYVPRISRVDGDKRTEDRARAGNGVVMEDYLFGNRFSAQVAKLELLHELAPWRMVLPHGVVPRGRTEAWIADAPLPRLPWMPMTRVAKRQL